MNGSNDRTSFPFSPAPSSIPRDERPNFLTMLLGCPKGARVHPSEPAVGNAEIKEIHKPNSKKKEKQTKTKTKQKQSTSQPVTDATCPLSQLHFVPAQVCHRRQDGKLPASTSPVQVSVPHRGVLDPGRVCDVIRGTLAALVVDIEAPAESFAIRINADGMVGTHGCRLRSSYRPCRYRSWPDQYPSLVRHILN